ncbi:Os01g0552050 [Oryza sativa Japonica Group]|uniref:Os01g0552050 protein n=1 Tax=Oryza sativa subsp. japonica TaxID=39947 RepID=A0A0P0V3Y3_ORYSJ|nr:hypothetical protein EE612_003400 [Oryza sativa]BAS72659.1 Os01g0552050 [Oryza sativa Japonica Group]
MDFCCPEADCVQLCSLTCFHRVIRGYLGGDTSSIQWTAQKFTEAPGPALTNHSHLPTWLCPGSPENNVKLSSSSLDTTLPVSIAHFTVISTPSTPFRVLLISITAMTLKDLCKTRCFFDLAASSSLHSRRVPSKQHVMSISRLTSD